MKFETFKEIIRENVSCKLGDGYKVTLNDIRKNNGLILTGLTIRRDDTNVAPTIYINEYYELYKYGRCTIYEAVDGILKTYERNKKQDNFNIKFFLDFETVRPRIIHKLVNTERNKDLLNEVPNVQFLDLSIIFQILLSDDTYPGGTATITIHNEHCKLWGIGVDDLVFSARRNTPKLLPYTAKDIGTVISELHVLCNEPDTYRYSTDADMIVTTNTRMTNGSCVMLDKDFLRECAENIGSSYYILPSSVHECLLLPDDGIISVTELKDMVQETNDTEVEPEDILSYSVYYFDKENDRLSVL